MTGVASSIPLAPGDRTLTPTIEVWSDIVCPWCAIGRARLHKALDQSGAKARIVHRAFELDPDAEGARSTHEVLQERYGPSADVKGMTRNVRELAAGDGLVLKTDEALAINTFDAHRLLLWAQEQGKGERMMDLLVTAHFEEIRDLGDRNVLVETAQAAGLDPLEAAKVLESDQYAEAVRSDEAAARRLGIRGVPFFVFDGKYGVSGAQGVEVFVQAIERTVSAQP